MRAALLRAWAPEHLAGADIVLCENCGVKRSAIRTVAPQQLPQVLVVLLRPHAVREVRLCTPRIMNARGLCDVALFLCSSQPDA